MRSTDSTPRSKQRRWPMIAGVFTIIATGAVALILPAVERVREQSDRAK
jgi:hypothetical protein